MRHWRNGFTLIELLVVIAIIGLLAAIVLTAVTSARKKSRLAIRATDMRQIATALDQYYYANNGTYPSTGGAWRGECVTGGYLPPSQVIPGLVPTYLSIFPTDPTMNAPTDQACYYYRSDTGADYKLVDYNIAEYTPTDYAAIPGWEDPARDGGSDPCSLDGTAYFGWAIYSPGGKCY